MLYNLKGPVVSTSDPFNILYINTGPPLRLLKKYAVPPISMYIHIFHFDTKLKIYIHFIKLS